MHFNHCLSSAKALPTQEVQKLHCADAAAFDPENLCTECLASLVDIFLESLFQNVWNNSVRLTQFTKQRFNNKQTVRKEFSFIHIIEICCISGMLVKIDRYWFLN